jgi:hypothetical protein
MNHYFLLVLGSWLFYLLPVICYLLSVNYLNYKIPGNRQYPQVKISNEPLFSLGSWFLALLSVASYLLSVISKLS